MYVTSYTSGLPETTRVRLWLPNSHALLGVIVFISAVQQQYPVYNIQNISLYKILACPRDISLYGGGVFRGLPEATGVRLRLRNSDALLGSGRRW